MLGAMPQEPPRRRPLTAASLENAALHYLQRFATSSENLRRVLMRRVERSARLDGADRDAGAALVDALVARYLRAGLLDDATYAAARTRSLHRRGLALRAIAGKLAERGVDGATIGAALAGLRDEMPDADLAAAVAYARRRRLGPFRPADLRPAHRDRDLAAMARAGFSYDVATRVTDAASVADIEALI